MLNLPKSIKFLILFSFVTSTLLAQAPDTAWTRTFGGIENDYGLSVWQTTDKGYIVVGRTESFGIMGESNIYLIKTDSLGDTLWTKIYVDSADQYGKSVQQIENKP